METALLISVVVALLAIPLFAAHDVNHRRGLKRAIAGVAAFNLLYAFMLRFVFPRLG